MSLTDNLSLVWNVITTVAVLLLWFARRNASEAVADAELLARLKILDVEVERLRKWRHDVIVPWQQELLGKLDDRYVLRRYETDSPFPNNRRKV